MRLIHVAGYYSQFAGSFVPLLRAALGEGLERGLRPEAVFPEAPADRRWVAQLDAARIPSRFIPFGGLSDVLAEDDGPAIVHVHFTQFQLEAARAARPRPDIKAFWHIHTKL